jgi:hypothetical protein
MAGYYMRFFSTTALGSITRLQLNLAERGCAIRPAGTNTIEVLSEAGFAPLRVKLNAAQDEITRQEVQDFIEAVAQRGVGNAAPVLDTLARTQTVVAVAVPAEADHDMVADVLEACAALGQGVIQVDGEGFYQDGVLLIELE